MNIEWTPPTFLDAPPEVVVSVRQAQVLSLICRGRSNQQIAREMFLTLHTVKTHVSCLYRLLGVQNRAHAVALAMCGRTRITVRGSALSIASRRVFA
jgi:ATP/maltotriose-dependent transcriptional regulator MalT